MANWILRIALVTALALSQLAWGQAAKKAEPKKAPEPPKKVEPQKAKIFEMPKPPAVAMPGQTVDINSATLDELRKLPAIGDSFAKKIVDGRPYKRKDELTSRNILPQYAYDKVKELLIAKQK